MSSQDIKGDKKSDNSIITEPSLLDTNTSQSIDLLSSSSVSNDNLRILYITFAIIIGLLVIWIIIVIVTKEDAIKILGEMNNMAAQTPAVTDSDIKSQDLIDNYQDNFISDIPA